MRRQVRMTQILQILLASDLTERSRCALVRAVELKRATAAGLTLLHVAEPGLRGELAKSGEAAAMATMGRISQMLPQESFAVCSLRLEWAIPLRQSSRRRSRETPTLSCSGNPEGIELRSCS